jgi:hypothetical protein
LRLAVVLGGAAVILAHQMHKDLGVGRGAGPRRPVERDRNRLAVPRLPGVEVVSNQGDLIGKVKLLRVGDCSRLALQSNNAKAQAVAAVETGRRWPVA